MASDPPALHQTLVPCTTAELYPVLCPFEHESEVAQRRESMRKVFRQGRCAIHEKIVAAISCRCWHGSALQFISNQLLALIVRITVKGLGESKRIQTAVMPL